MLVDKTYVAVIAVHIARGEEDDLCALCFILAQFLDHLRIRDMILVLFVRALYRAESSVYVKDKGILIIHFFLSPPKDFLH